MSTLLCIQSWAGAKDHVFAMWQSYQTSGMDIWITCPVNSFHELPAGCKFSDRIGNEGWLTHEMIKRWVAAWEHFLDDPKFKQYDDMFMCPFDVLFVRKPPPHPGGLVTHLAGGKLNQGERTGTFYHPPWWADREAAKVIVRSGRQFMADGIWELNAPDVFLGYIIEQSKLPWKPANVYSVNGGMMQARLGEACDQIRAGIWFLHGVINADQRDILLAAIPKDEH